MKEFFRHNLIRIAIGIICSLILVSAGLTYYNNKVMSDAIVLKEQSNFALREVERVYQNIQLMDISSRGYALIRKPEYLFWSVAMARERNRDIFQNLDSIFAVQQFNNPENYQQVKKGLDNYTDMYAVMVSHLQANEDSLYVSLLGKDQGRYFWEVFNPFSQNVNSYERQINEEAQHAYERAATRNIVVQLLLIFAGIPTLVFVVYRLARDERERRALLLNVAENNKKYLFDDGQEHDSEVKDILDHLIVDLKRAATFVNEISARNYDAQWEGLQAQNQASNTHTLAGRLMYMRDEMKRVKEEDNKRIWSTEGLSELSQIIRKYQHDPKELTFRSLTFLVKYTKSQQGSIFVLQHDDEDSEPYLSLDACYAFERKKFVEKRINLGEGLVGQAFLEKQTIMLKVVPREYISITSGLGDATPNCVILVPMKYNEAVHAVFELASFRVFAAHEVDFLEKAGEFIASAISSAQNNERNRVMMEQMRSQTEQMRAQEEELRQNLEELEATQEDMRRKLG
jgi:CHASE3 domain sensor protein